MQLEPPFFHSEDLFVISGDQISRLAHLARQQCGGNINTDQMLSVLREVLENKLAVPQKMPSPGSGQTNYQGFSQGDPIEKLR